MTFFRSSVPPFSPAGVKMYLVVYNMLQLPIVELECILAEAHKKIKKKTEKNKNF
jgi:hypothetical protein